MVPIFQKIVVVFVMVSMIVSCKTDPTTSTAVSKAEAIENINLRLRALPDKLNPYQTRTAYTTKVTTNIFPMVLEFDPVTLDFTPYLSETLPEISENEDETVDYTYTILEEAKWDNGSPITGKDVEFTLKTLFNPKVTGVPKLYKSLMQPIKEITIDPTNPKKYTIKIISKNIGGMKYTSSWIIPEYFYDPAGVMKNFTLDQFIDKEKLAKISETDMDKLSAFDAEYGSPKFTKDPNGISNAGPYKLESWEDHVVLKKKENWWGDALVKERPILSAYPKSITFKIAKDNEAGIAMVKNGDLDILSTVEANSFNSLKENEFVNSKYNFLNPETFYQNYVGFNNSNPKLSDPKVRHALNYLSDRKKIIDFVYAGYGNPIYDPFFPNDGIYDQKYAVDFSFEKGTKLLDEAGWVDSNGNGIRDKQINGKLVELTLEILTTPNNSIAESMIRVLSEDYAKAGVKMISKALEAREYFSARNRGDFEVFSGSMIGNPGYYNPSQYWTSTSPSNYFKSGSAERDEVIKSIEGEFDEGARNILYERFLELFHEEMPILYLVNSNERVIVSKKIKKTMFTKVRPGYKLGYFQ